MVTSGVKYIALITVDEVDCCRYKMLPKRVVVVEGVEHPGLMTFIGVNANPALLLDVEIPALLLDAESLVLSLDVENPVLSLDVEM